MEDILRKIDQISCIYYPLSFWKDIIEVKAIIDFGSKVNAMTLGCALKLGLKIHKPDVKAQGLRILLSKPSR